jgi:hypothetical protein
MKANKSQSKPPQVKTHGVGPDGYPLYELSPIELGTLQTVCEEWFRTTDEVIPAGLKDGSIGPGLLPLFRLMAARVNATYARVGGQEKLALKNA